MREEMLQLTKEMVKIPSVNGTKGEQEIGRFIEQYMREIPYFQEHPDQVIVQQLRDDPLERRNVFALLKGEKEENPNTILLHGHTDTVGVEDFGELAEYAFDPDRLAEELGKIELPEEVREDLKSGEYLFGRGACDMKSGDAVFMVLIRHLAAHVKEFSGNLLLSCNPVEENLHTGIVEGIDQIEKIRQEHGLRYVLAINNDYTCPMYPNDPHRYIYTGVGGKLLPCFYIQGQETHVGQCFEGFDPTTVAAKLADKINLNPEFSDGYQGEYSLPPVALKLKDLKGWYNVQTAKEAFVYFNYFVHNKTTEEIVDSLTETAKEVVAETCRDMNTKYEQFCILSGKEPQELKKTCEVLSYEQLYQRASEMQGDGLEEEFEQLTQQLIEKKIDQRELPITLIRRLLARAKIYHPVVILYFAAPYCPHNTLKEESMIRSLEKITEEVGAAYGHPYEIGRFFPSLSDSSYLAIDDPKESIHCLEANFPQMQQLYPLPFKKMKDLKIPAVNFGVYGKDAHKWTERLNIPYSFEVLPELIEKAIEEFL